MKKPSKCWWNILAIRMIKNGRLDWRVLTASMKNPLAGFPSSVVCCWFPALPPAPPPLASISLRTCRCCCCCSGWGFVVVFCKVEFELELCCCCWLSRSSTIWWSAGCCCCISLVLAEFELVGSCCCCCCGCSSSGPLLLNTLFSWFVSPFTLMMPLKSLFSKSRKLSDKAEPSCCCCCCCSLLLLLLLLFAGGDVSDDGLAWLLII